jgi:uncharacterized membrane protein
MSQSRDEKKSNKSDGSGLVDIARIASFSDNVISIALTLLVLDVRIPGPINTLSWQDVRAQLLPRLMSFLLSFAIVGVYWVAHHVMFNAMHSAGRVILWLNNLFLLAISLVPASAALLGAHVQSPIPTLLYGLNIAAVGLAMLAMWHYTVRRHRKLGIAIDPQISYLAYSRTIFGIGIALTGAAIGLFRPGLSYGIFWLAPIVYILLQSKPQKITDAEELP